MAISTGGSFDGWLLEKLSSVSTEFDTDVFVTYIITILEEDDPDEDKSESITELLSGVVEADIAAETCKFILAEWKASCEINKKDQVTEDMGDKLSEMLGKQNLATVKEKTLTKEEKALKDAILAQYCHISDGEETDEDDFVVVTDDSTSSSNKTKQNPIDDLLMKNVNKEEVNRAEREMREKSKQEAEKKKEKDKQDRLAQKQKQEERKEAEKKRTQKGERRR